MVQQGVQGLTSPRAAARRAHADVRLQLVLALVFLATVPVYAVLMRFSSKRLRPMFDSLEEAFGKYSSHQIDAIKGIETVKAIAGEQRVPRADARAVPGSRAPVFRADFTIMSLRGRDPARLASCRSRSSCGSGALQVLDGDLTIGELVAFNALVALANGPIISLLGMWDELQYSSVLLDRLTTSSTRSPSRAPTGTQLTAGAKRSKDGSGSRTSASATAADVAADPGGHHARRRAGHDGRDRRPQRLRQDDARQVPGGPARADRGHDPFDGVDMRTLDYRDLRRQIGFVLQENHLFDDTIARNIAFGEEEPDMDRVLWAAQGRERARVHRAPAARLRDADRRVRPALSGGQRQRIAIARARLPPAAGAHLRRGDERARHASPSGR